MNLLRYKDRIWNPMDTGINWEILDESHATLLFSSFRHHGGVLEFESFIVMAWDGEGHNGICGKVLNLLAGQDRVSETSKAIVAFEYSIVEIRKHRDGFHGRDAQGSGSA